MSEDKSSKSNGLGSDPMQRLPGLKAPRDLLLGGIKPNKKVFTPNLNVARNKNKGPTTSGSRDQKKDDKGRRERKNDRNKNFKNGPNVIKSSGVFSEGLGSSERHSSRISYGRDSDTTPTLQKPTIRVKDVIKIDKELEEQKIRSVFGDSGTADDDESVDFKQVHERDAPIKLPMDDGGWALSQTKPKVRVKQEVIVKMEPGLDNECVVTDSTETPPAEVKAEAFEDIDVVNLLRSDKPTLILLQLPDTLPGRGNAEEEAPRRAPHRAAPTPTPTSAPTAPTAPTAEPHDDKPVDNRCRLADLEEGRIGKLLIHRSGRVSLALGDTIFEVSMGTKAAFHQEVVSVAADEASRAARLVALGALRHKLAILPDWEAMFRDMPV